MNDRKQEEKMCIMTGFAAKNTVYDRIIYKKILCDIVSAQTERKEERE